MKTTANNMANDKGLFISHAHADALLVGALRTLIDDLFSNHFEIFATSINPLKGGAEWRKEIQSNLERARVVLVVITPQSFKKEWVFFEAGAAWLETATNQKRLIPCRYNHSDFSSTLSEFQGVDLSDSESIRAVLVPALSDVSGGLRPADKFLKLAIEEFSQALKKIPPLPLQSSIDQSVLPEAKKLLGLVITFFGDDTQSAIRFANMLKRHNVLDDVLLKEFMIAIEAKD